MDEAAASLRRTDAGLICFQDSFNLPHEHQTPWRRNIFFGKAWRMRMGLAEIAAGPPRRSWHNR
jgi:hypothetical protein